MLLLLQALCLLGCLALAGMAPSSSVRDLEQEVLMSTCISPEMDTKAFLSTYSNVDAQLTSSKLPYEEGRQLIHTASDVT